MTARVLDSRVDALVIGYRVRIPETMRRALDRAAAAAQKHGRGSFHLGPHEFELRVTRAGLCILRNECATVTVNRAAPGELSSRLREKEAARRADDERRLDADREARAELAARRRRASEAAEGPQDAVPIVEPIAGPKRIDEGLRTREGRYAGVDPNPSGEVPGWNVDVELRATLLAAWRVPTAPAWIAKTLAMGLGHVHEERVRRVDLAATVLGFSLAGLSESFAGTRSRVDEYVEDRATGVPASLKLVTHRRGRTLTGYTIAAGNCRMARLYDKRDELRVKGDLDKRAIERSIWEAAGHYELEPGHEGPELPVTRVEFQLRGEALDKWPDMRTPFSLQEWLDTAWAWLTEKWLRVVQSGTATRRRRARLHPAWKAARKASFGASVSGARWTERGRRGPSARLLFGLMLGRVCGERGHGRGCYDKRPRVRRLFVEPDPSPQLSLYGPDWEAHERERQLAASFRAQAERLGALAVESLVKELASKGPVPAYEYAAERARACAARYVSV